MGSCENADKNNKFVWVLAKIKTYHIVIKLIAAVFPDSCVMLQKCYHEENSMSKQSGSPIDATARPPKRWIGHALTDIKRPTVSSRPEVGMGNDIASPLSADFIASYFDTRSAQLQLRVLALTSKLTAPLNLECYVFGILGLWAS